MIHEKHSTNEGLLYLKVVPNQDGTFSRTFKRVRQIVKYTGQGSGSPVSVSGSVPSGKVYRLSAVTMHLSGSSTAVNFVVSLNAQSGSAFDVVYSTTAMSGLTDVAYVPTNDLLLQGEDIVVVTYTNANLRAYGIEIVMEDCS
jgi:hypothetical protein